MAGGGSAVDRPGATPRGPVDVPALVAALVAAGRTVAVAESLTGGAVVDALVSVPGASGCVRGGVVAYATDVKADVLGVDRALLADHGPVHRDVALGMAEGVRDLLRADYGIGTTGVAGPGSQDGHPAGTFHVAVVGPAGAATVSSEPGVGGATGGRGAVRAAARDAALALLARELGEDAGPRTAAPPYG